MMLLLSLRVQRITRCEEVGIKAATEITLNLYLNQPSR